MLTSAILKVLVAILSVFVFWIPDVTSLDVLDLGIFGAYSSPFTIDTYLSTGMGYLMYLVSVFPPLGTIYYGFMTVLYWRAFVLFLKILPFTNRIFK